MIERLCVEKRLVISQFLAMRSVLKGKALMERRSYPKRWMTLITIVLSSRTKDEVTEESAKRLFCRFPSLSKIAGSSKREIAKLIFPVGFYNVKAKNIVALARRILADYGGKVPCCFEELIKLPGVGRKTANLYLSLYGQPTIAVDTHVNRIANRIPWVDTSKPEHTENVLKKLFPKNEWSQISSTLVPFGQQVCRPAAPKCDMCPKIISRVCLYRRCQSLVKEVKKLKTERVGEVVKRRINEFHGVSKKGEKRWFKELVYCVLTAHTSAKMGLRAMEFLKDDIFSKEVEVIEGLLRKSGYRFPKTRARYIVDNRKFLGRLKKTILAFKSWTDVREWLVKNIKGFGFKEASHFLRNVGYKDVAIIDFHILDILKKEGVIDFKKYKVLNPARYLEIELILRKIARWCNVNLAMLDLYLWYLETGKILR